MACDSILMLDPGIRVLPATDDKGIYVRRFTTVHLIELLLPKAATISGGLTDLTFVHDELEERNTAPPRRR